MLIATNIQWDYDENDDEILLPTEIEIPKELTNEDEISDYISDTTGYCHKGFVIEEIKLITEYVDYDDIDLYNKLDNMLDSEISEEIYKKCIKDDNFKKIEKKVWEIINDITSEYCLLETYEGLAKEYDAKDENDMWSACLYNCDTLYMTAIANVFNLEIPETGINVEIFGIS